VSDGRYRDPRIVHALALLHDCLHRPPVGPNPLAYSGSSDDWLVSSTDILAPWYPETAPTSPVDDVALTPPAGVWDAYFAGMTPSFRGDRVELDRRPTPPVGESFLFEPGDPSASAAPVALESPSTTADSDSSVAEAVVETLYGFLHAIERADVPSAMRCVAADYHAMEDDREITRDVLRQQIEDLVDARRGRGLDVSLAQVPEPIASPYGVLVKLTIQIDSRDDGGLPRSSLLHRVAVFQRDREDRWRLASLGVVSPVP
jgi:hypothetical protein